jgi:hypothetical protein
MSNDRLLDSLEIGFFLSPSLEDPMTTTDRWFHSAASNRSRCHGAIFVLRKNNLFANAGRTVS